MPEEGVELVPKADVLTFEEVERLVRVMMRFGVRRVRLTGGEPTVRKDVVELVARLGALGLDDLAMTTNGERLVELAAPLRSRGPGAPQRQHRHARSPRSSTPSRAAAISSACSPASSGRAPSASSAPRSTPSSWAASTTTTCRRCAPGRGRARLVPRFIESMPMSDGALFVAGAFVPAAAIRARIEAAFGPLVAEDEGRTRAASPASGPARYQRVAGGDHQGHRVGIISAVTEPFCATCNRVRLTATGQLHTCLALDDDADLRTPLRCGASDDELARKVLVAVSAKKEGHTFSACGTGGPRKHMVAIGG